jgi:phosphohistidine phosphatase
MVHLMLLRHAKSDWSNEELTDKDRPLNLRGQKAAPEMGRWMQKHDWLPDRILCSSAKRTIETLDRIQEVWRQIENRDRPIDAGIDVHFLDQLYLAPPQTILEEAIRYASKVQSLLIIGHNPGMEMLATRLSDGECEMRTCSLVIFEARPRWPDDWWDSSSWTRVAKHRA